jgi:HEAT repeat protein
MLDDADENVRTTAAGVLKEVVEAQPQVVNADLIAALVPVLNDADENVRAAAAGALGRVVTGQPQLAEDAVAGLVPLLDDADENVRAAATGALGRVVTGQPQLAEDAVAGLVPLLDDADENVRAAATRALGEVGTAQPQVAEEVVAQLVAQPEDEDGNVRQTAAAALGDVGAAQPQVAEDAVAALIPRLDDESEFVRAAAAAALGEVAEANPDLSTADLVMDLVPLLTSADLSERIYVARLIGQLVDVNPDLANMSLTALTPLLADNESFVNSSITTPSTTVRFLVAETLADIYVQQGDIDALMALLTDPLKSLEHPVAARALFLIALNNPERLEELRAELTAHAAGREPIARIWANKTLAMLDLAEWAHTAAADAEQCEAIEWKLQKFAPGPYSQYPPSFFGEEFNWAAEEALDWLREEVGDDWRGEAWGWTTNGAKG